MEKKNRRIITFLIGIYLWTLYIFQNEMADYGMYTVISYRTHEVASVIPFLCIGVTIIWFAYLLLRIMKKQVDKSDKVFIIILLGLVLLQGNYIRQMSSQWTTTAFVKIERIDETQGIIFLLFFCFAKAMAA